MFHTFTEGYIIDFQEFECQNFSTLQAAQKPLECYYFAKYDGFEVHI
jgi:hypothetical protein